MRSGIKTMTTRFGAAALLIATGWLMTAGLNPAARAANGTWNVTPTGEWDTASSWLSNQIADGANFTANFTQPDVDTVGTIVTLSLDANLDGYTIGNLVFSDSNPLTGVAGNWELQGTFPLTLSNTTQPTVTVDAMNPGGAAIINTVLAGTQGLTKAGVGTLRLGSLGGAHTIVGGINVNGGTLQYDDGATVPVQAITIRNGATLSVAAGIGTATTGIINIPAAMVGNIVTRNGGSLNAIGGGAGSALNLSTATDGATIAAAGNWATGGSLGALTVTGVVGGANERFNLNANGGGFTNNSFQNTAVTLNDVVTYTRTNSGGNTINFGSLAGNANAILFGGGFGAAGGTVARYSIGSLNTSTVYAGNIDTTTLVPGALNTGGLDLIKVGTGTLTLSGTLAYQPTFNSNASNRGGITTVSAGTLKLTGSAAIPGGQTDGVTTVLSTVKILAGATLDVSGTSTPYSTASMQQVIGAGTIVGNYGHDEGTLAPGDVNSGTSAALTATAGTLIFGNNLDFAGAGEIKFNISPSLVSGNDQIRVIGSTSLTGTPTLNFGFLGGFSAGTYTIIQSDGGFGGTIPSGWVVNWPGRGTPTLATSGNLLQLVVGAGSASGSVRWTGNVTSDWVPGSSGDLNWFNTGTNAADKYFDQDNVTFADTYGPSNTAVTNGVVTLNGSVAPLSVAVNNSAVAYQISGTGKITGATGFTKTGNGTVILQTANDFTGPSAISGGTVDIGAFPTALGTGVLTLTNSTVTVAAVGTISNSSLVVPAAAVSTLNANGGTGALVLPALSGDGLLTIQTATTNKLVDLATSNTAFTGDLTLGDAMTLVPMIARTSGAGSGFVNSAITLNGTSLRDRATSAQTIALGSLNGNSTSVLYGYQGGSGATAKTWSIGALNTSTTFAGSTANGSGDSNTRSLTNIIKVGTGTLTLSGALAHGGTTTVNAGTLLINGTHLVDVTTPAPGTPFTVGDYIVNTSGTLGGTGTIGDVADPGPAVITVNSGGKLAPGAGGVGTLTVSNGNVVIGAGGTFAIEIDSSGVADRLVLNGITLPSLAVTGNLTLNATSSLSVANIGAAPFGVYTIATYTGALTGVFGNTGGYTVNYATPGVITLNYTAAPIPGDFDKNGQVNAADLAVWRTAFSTTALGDADSDGDSDGNDFLVWQRNLGKFIPPATATAGAVPEPTAALLAVGALLGLAGASRRRR